MQTFMPYSDFTKSAQVLDNKRLNKQHVECKQIINVLEGNSAAWKNHPAVRMWDGYIPALKAYANEIKKECLKRGFKSEKIPFYDVKEFERPFWLGDIRVHTSHRSNLNRKDPSFYYGFANYGIEGYYWPVKPKGKRCIEVNELWENIFRR